MRASDCLYLAVTCLWLSVATSEDEDKENGQQDFKQKAIVRLSKVFDIDRLPHRLSHRSPPQYMVDLYKSVADSDGITKHRGPYGSDVVRGLPDRATTHQMHFFFNVSYVNEKEQILQAELHLFKLRPRPPGNVDPLMRHHNHLVELKLYAVEDEHAWWSPGGLTLLDHHRISPYHHGWHVFKIKDTVQRWINQPSTNKGFLITATSPFGKEMNGTYVRFAQRSEHHDSKQPVLVVFTDKFGRSTLTGLQNDKLSSVPEIQEEAAPVYAEEEEEEEETVIRDDIMSKTRQNYIKFMNEGFRNGLRSNNTIKSDIIKERFRRSAALASSSEILSASAAKNRAFESAFQYRSRREKRSKRTVDYYHYPRKRKSTCAKHELYVDFDEIGWSGWIISPKGYNAYHCKGECPFPLGQNQKPTNHATVQSIVHALRIGKDVGTPCCVPNKLYSISLLYFDDDENVILKQYDDMVAANCGCH